MAERKIPKYIKREFVSMAVAVAVSAVLSKRIPVKRQDLHVVVLVPEMQDDRAYDYPSYLSWSNYPVMPYLIYQESFGNTDKWEHPYADIARCKALQLWTGRNDGRAGVIPHLLFSGDTPYWGGVKRDGIVVACSGVQPWFDRLIAGIVADTIVALAHDAYENDEERKKGVDFLS